MNRATKRQLISDALANLSEDQRDYAVPYLLNCLAQMLTEERLQNAIAAAEEFAKKHSPPPRREKTSS